MLSVAVRRNHHHFIPPGTVGNLRRLLDAGSGRIVGLAFRYRPFTRCEAEREFGDHAVFRTVPNSAVVTHNTRPVARLDTLPNDAHALHERWAALLFQSNSAATTAVAELCVQLDIDTDVACFVYEIGMPLFINNDEPSALLKPLDRRVLVYADNDATALPDTVAFPTNKDNGDKGGRTVAHVVWHLGDQCDVVFRMCVRAVNVTLIDQEDGTNTATISFRDERNVAAAAAAVRQGPVFPLVLHGLLLDNFPRIGALCANYSLVPFTPPFAAHTVHVRCENVAAFVAALPDSAVVEMRGIHWYSLLRQCADANVDARRNDMLLRVLDALAIVHGGNGQVAIRSFHSTIHHTDGIDVGWAKQRFATSFERYLQVASEDCCSATVRDVPSNTSNCVLL